MLDLRSHESEKECQLTNYKIKKIDEFFYLLNDRNRIYNKQRFTVIFSVILIPPTISLSCFIVNLGRFCAIQFSY